MTWTFTEPQPGDIIARRYRVEQTLGRGGFGIVFMAHDLQTQRTVALKVLHATYARKDPRAVERFRREALLSASISYPNSVRVFDYGETDDGIFFLVMELLRGEHLTALLERVGPLDERRALHITRQILQSLMEAHEQGIVHRDIKPENIMLVPLAYDPDFVKVMDFGIAKMASGAGPQITQAGQTFGTPRYMAPEQLQGGQLSPSTDLYAVGLLLYEMMVGQPAVTAESLADTISAVIFGEPIALPPGLPASAQARALVTRATARDPQQRFLNAQSFLTALQAAEAALPNQLIVAAPPAAAPAPRDQFSAETLALDTSHPDATSLVAYDLPSPPPAEAAPAVVTPPAPDPGLWRWGCVLFAALFAITLACLVALGLFFAARMR